ncbi:MAG: DUF1080 domain-containing protein [Bacteroidota bacterium]
MKILTGIILLGVMVGCSQPTAQQQTNAEPEAAAEPVAEALNVLSASEEADGWKLLFDGSTSDGWRGYGKENFPKAWKVEDGAFYLPSKTKRTDDELADAGDIIYDQEFENFHLKLEWKIGENGNSGIFYLGQELPDFGPIYKTAPEMQVLDNDGHPDSDRGKDGNRKASSLYDLIPAVPQNANPAGEWNAVEVIKNGKLIQHVQNGEVVVSYEYGTDEWIELVAGSKFPGLNEDWANLSDKGLIGLQDHRDDVWFRNIKIKEL